MKLFILILISLNIAYARQYIQCSSIDVNSSNGVVININDIQSTLFMTNGVHLPDGEYIGILKNINFLKEEDGFTFFTAQDDKTIETVKISTNYLGLSLDYISVEFIIKKIDSQFQYIQKLSCFSSIYND